MKLYYFTSERYGLEAIRDRRIKISTIGELNDPFEWFSLTGGRVFRRKIRAFRNEVASKQGIICMSYSWQHPLLWAHYADNHKGLCLGFDVADQMSPMKVRYVSERLEWQAIRSGPIDDYLKSVTGIFNTKFDAWEYESEYRIMVDLKHRDPVSGLYFEPFSESIALSQVILGERSSVTRGHLQQVLGPSLAGVARFKVRSGFKRFEMVENKLARAWRK